ncbi:outer membrane protein OmpW, partial [Salmonella enterica]|nr:outer membrane protein OmpW [Salmonella enterica]EBR0108656.1 outer membrane protein OmpW [Salmonella enterica subsp. houtenae serovar Houten]
MWVYSLRFYNHNDGAGMKKFTVAALALTTLLSGSA